MINPLRAARALVRWGRAQAAALPRSTERLARPTALIVEPSLTSLEGHHLEVAASAAAGFTGLGCEALIFAHVDAPADLEGTTDGVRVVPAFRLSGYATFQGGPRPLRKLLRDALGFATDLGQAVAASRSARPHLIFFQSSNLAQLVGAALFTPGLLLPWSDEQQVHLLRFDPHRPQFGAPEHDYAPNAWRWAFRLVNPLIRAGRLRIVSDSAVVADALRRVGAAHAAVVPIPTVVRPRSSEDAGRAITLGFLGGARSEKGALLLPELIERLLPLEGVRFLLQVNPNLPEPSLLAAVERLRELGRGDARVQVIDEPLTSSRYRALLDEVDILLMPYDPDVYQARTSGPAIEGMAAAKVIVGPQEGWLAREGRKYPAYLAADSRDPAAFASRVEEAVRDLDRLRALARIAAADVHRFHSARELALRVGGWRQVEPDRPPVGNLATRTWWTGWAPTLRAVGADRDARRLVVLFPFALLPSGAVTLLAAKLRALAPRYDRVILTAYDGLDEELVAELPGNVLVARIEPPVPWRVLRRMLASTLPGLSLLLPFLQSFWARSLLRELEGPIDVLAEYPVWYLGLVGLPRPRRLVVTLLDDLSDVLRDNAAAGIGLTSALALPLERALLGRADQLFTINEDEARQYVARGHANQFAPVALWASPPAAWGVEWAQREFCGRFWLFVGSDYGPNREALRWLLDRVLPLTDEGSQVIVVGSICDRLAPHPRAVPLGRLEHDRLAALYAACTAAVVPMLSGTGASIKALEALAHGARVVATTIGARGVGSESEERLRLADTPDAFARALRELSDAPRTRHPARADDDLVAHYRCFVEALGRGSRLGGATMTSAPLARGSDE